jgi:hypothetical protein
LSTSWLKGTPYLYILFLAIEAMFFGFTEYPCSDYYYKAKQELACNNNTVESLKTGRFETGSCIADLTTAPASYYNQLLPTVSNLLKIVSTVGQLTTTD